MSVSIRKTGVVNVGTVSETYTGSIVTFNSQYAGLPLKSHKIAVTATQSGSGTPSPSNPRPITGYSAINISHSDADTSNPTVYTIQIGSTVYGGEYDARTGLLTVTHKGIDLGSLTWYSSVGFHYATINDGKFASNSRLAVAICEQYRVTSGSSLSSTNNAFCYGLNNLPNLWVNDSNLNSLSANDFKTAMSGINLVYELATPITIQLPPCPIDTLEGVNNIWADTGDTTLSPYAGGFNEINAVRASIAEGYINSTEFIEI